ncbi:amidophosphoribosyltransferase [Sedimentibacter sp. zth1]|uniref:amidophosphoribosyltransferase n=1 Tax=Sedimentibacter sp. zth1 TaxID=2816908 RepID=UPI001A930CC7|nr:amidophosphoribosyltransferase [Sedimentibacter sp. zth1]QSX04980.1 amidophosphoribosyltransferase [Sedimentibacter sp. zth1]
MYELLMDDKMHEECGVIGVYTSKPELTTQLVYYGLFALQHRGQESAGIAISTEENHIEQHKGMGLVSEIFTNDVVHRLSGNVAIGHVRYSTTGTSKIENAQPLVVNYKKGSFALAHNGNLVNADSLKEILEDEGVIFQTTTDTEVVANMMARNYKGNIVKSIKNVMEIIKGAFAFTIMDDKSLIGVRDHFGLRPLCIGKRDDGYLLASESCAISAMGGEFIRDVEPGEIVVINENGIESIKSTKYAQKKSCIFEFVYFARPDSTIDGINVYQARFNAGKQLAKEAPVKADLVFSVPDSGTPAAIGYAQELGIPYGLGLIKNRYAKRTFIEPNQELREEGVKLKLSVLKELVKDKVVVIIDDSIVRGTTSKQLAKMVRDAGAKEVHMRIASPPVTHSCFFGINTPFRNYLIGATKSLEEMTEFIQADSLQFLSIDGLIKATGKENGFCLACLNGDYPMEVPNFK